MAARRVSELDLRRWVLVAQRVAVQTMLLVAIGLTSCIESACGESVDPTILGEGGGVHPADAVVSALPVEFDVVAINRLYVDGVLIEHVCLTTEEGDSLYLNGVPILPRRPCPKSPPLSEEIYARLYGSVPFVQELMKSGVSAREAGEAYGAERDRIFRELRDIYVAARRSGRDKDAAGAEAFAALKDIDEHELINWDGEVSQSYNSFVVKWKGMRAKAGMLLPEPMQKAPPEQPAMPSEEEKRILATRLYQLLGRGGAPCWYVITCGGISIDVGEEAVARVKAHLDEARKTGVIKGGVLSRRPVEQILANEERIAQPSN